MLTEFVAKYTFDTGPFTVGMVLATDSPIGSELGNAADTRWAARGVQSARGQELALEIYQEQYDKDQRRLKDEYWNALCGACGMWVSFEEHLLPSLLVHHDDAKELLAEFKRVLDFRDCLLSLASLDRPSSQQMLV